MTRNHPQPCGKGLEENRHQIGHQKHPDQRVAEPGTSLQIRRPVARVHVADTHQVGRPQEGEKPAQLLPLSPRGWNSVQFPDPCNYYLYIIFRFPASGESNKQKLFFGAPKTAGNLQRVLISMPTGNDSAARMKVGVVRSDGKSTGQQRRYHTGRHHRWVAFLRSCSERGFCLASFPESAPKEW